VLSDRDFVVVNEVVFAVLGEFLFELVVVDFEVLFGVVGFIDWVLDNVGVVMISERGFLSGASDECFAVFVLVESVAGFFDFGDGLGE
jgi:hypothetical protein